MWQSLEKMTVAPLELAIRAVVVYLAILILLRISGKRQVGQMGAVELVTILLISNAVQNSMNGGDNSLAGGLVLAAVLVGLSMAFSWLGYHSKTFAAVFEGTPRLLVHDGKRLEAACHKELLTHQELHVLLRKQGIQQLRDVKSAVLEADGSLSVVRYQDLADHPKNPSAAGR